MNDVCRYSAAVLSSAVSIQSLKPSLIRTIPQDDILFDPEYFLGSLSEGWIPQVVTVHDRDELAGVLYAKERSVSGFRLGIVYADLSFGGVPIGNTIQRRDTFRVALETLLASPGIRGVRLQVLRSSPELAAVRELIAAARLDVYFTRFKYHADLPLPNTYEEFLLGLGSTTRHNFRYYRRRFEAAGHTFLESLSMDELRSAAHYLEPRCAKPKRPGAIEKSLAMVAAASRPLRVGLKHRNGEWLSIIGGVYRPGAGVLLMQLNDERSFPRDSLAVVLRAYLIETLIRRGMKDFIIWAGTAPPLSRYVKPIRTMEIHLDLPGFGWRLARRVVSLLGPCLPARLRPDARWIAPFRQSPALHGRPRAAVG